jgi:hypothetical protein
MPQDWAPLSGSLDLYPCGAGAVAAVSLCGCFPALHGLCGVDRFEPRFELERRVATDCRERLLFRTGRGSGNRFPSGLGSTAVVIPVLTQHYAMLQRNLLYTGVTRGKKLVVLIGQKKAIAIAVRNISGRRRWSKLAEWLQGLANL